MFGKDMFFHRRGESSETGFAVNPIVQPDKTL